MAGDRPRLQALQNDRRVHARRVHLAGDPVEDVLQRRVVDRRRRRQIRTEDAHVQAAEAAQGTEPLALTSSVVDRQAPVRPNAELVRAQPPDVAPGSERHGHVLEGGPLLAEPRLRLAGSHPADVDTGDAHAVREAGG